MNHLKLTLLITSFVIPFILSATLFVGSKNNLPKQVIGFALLNAFFVFLGNYFYFQKLYTIYSFGHSLHIATVLWIFPSIYLYIKAIVSEEKEFGKELFHLLPGFVFGIISAILFYGFLNQDERIFYLTNYRTGTEFTNLNLKAVSLFRFTDVVLIVAQVFYYSVALIRIPRQYEKKLEQEYSNIERFSIKWVQRFNIAFVFIGLLSISFYIFNPFKEANEFFLVFFLFSISAFIWVIGLLSFKQEKPKEAWQSNGSIPIPIPDNSKNKEEELANKLLAYFQKEKPFLKYDLSLTAVCKEIGTNRSYLSAIINSKFEMNFNRFVNQYRVRYIEEYLEKKPRTPKEELVQIGGFGSISSLNRALNKLGK